MESTPEQVQAAEAQLLNSFFGMAAAPDSAEAAEAADRALAELDAVLEGAPGEAA
ncbi:ABC transporter ATP-binding protein [Streptomyces sp. NPDC000658]|uniref:ABC transporter ATP-binding protein n=1 Tax=Streptomyces sp. NPDC000658 TaxID=3154266 RepID=UPI00332C9605